MLLPPGKENRPDSHRAIRDEYLGISRVENLSENSKRRRLRLSKPALGFENLNPLRIFRIGT